MPTGGGTNAVSMTTSSTNAAAPPTGSAPSAAPPAPPAVEDSSIAASSSSSSSSSEPAADNQATPGRFVPTKEWLQAVKNELPLTTIMRLLQHLVPQVDELIKRSEGSIDEAQIMSFIVNTTMVGLLPVPHPIVIRKYTPNHFTGLWFTAFLWGVVFLQNQYMPLYDGSTIKLFTVTVARPPPTF